VNYGDGTSGYVVLEQDPVREEDVHDALADIRAAPPDDPATEARPNASAGWETALDVPPMPKAERYWALNRPRPDGAVIYWAAAPGRT